MKPLYKQIAKMKIIIMAGGKGERLKPITNNIPKPMVRINSKPVLLHIVEYFKKQNLSDFIFTLGYKADSVKSYFGSGSKFGVKIEYTLEDENNPLGTAGGVGLTRDLINDTFIVTCGDALRKLQIKPALDFHKKSGGIATMLLHKPISEVVTSMVRFNKQNKLIGFIERPTLKQLNFKEVYMNSSIYILEPKVFDFIPINKKSDSTSPCAIFSGIASTARTRCS